MEASAIMKAIYITTAKFYCNKFTRSDVNPEDTGIQVFQNKNIPNVYCKRYET